MYRDSDYNGRGLAAAMAMIPIGDSGFATTGYVNAHMDRLPSDKFDIRTQTGSLHCFSAPIHPFRR